MYASVRIRTGNPSRHVGRGGPLWLAQTNELVPAFLAQPPWTLLQTLTDWLSSLLLTPL